MNLLMLTKFYPFGTGEAFIENEIGVLSAYYDEILIIACEVAEKDQTARPLPTNVTALRVPSGSKMTDALKGITMYLKRDDAVMEEKDHAKGILPKVFLGYFEAKSLRVFDYIMTHHDIGTFCARPFVLYSYWFFMTARVGTLIKEKYAPKYMFTRAHRYDLYEEKNRANYLPYRRRFLASFNQVFPCSDNGTAYLKARYPEYADKVQTAFLGTMDHGVGKESTDGVFRIVSCSRVEPVKRVGRIVDALQKLDDGKTAIEWTHIGDGSELETVRKMAEEKLKTIRCRFLGNRKNADVMALYQNEPFDLLVNVSDSEGLPVSIMEAISFGIPVVGTDVGGTSEIVVDGKTGKLISADFSNDELASVIRNFSVRGDMWVERTSCRQFWEERFQAVPNYRKLCEYIEEQYN